MQGHSVVARCGRALNAAFMAKAPAPVVDALASQPDALQNEWLSELKKRGTGADHRISESELGQQGRELLQLLGSAVATGTDMPVRRLARRARVPRAAVALARPAGIHVGRDGDVRLLAEAAAVRARPRAPRKDAASVGRRDVGGQRADRRAGPAHGQDVPEDAARTSSTASRKRCWSCRRRSSSCGTACSRCR